MQNRRDRQTLAISSFGMSDICLILALKALLYIYPGSDNNPLFQIFKKIAFSCVNRFSG